MHASLQSAADFALAHETPWPRDPLAPPAPGQAPWGVHHEDPPPYNRLLGPVGPRAGAAGVVQQHGQRLAAWGDCRQPELTFSVAKTYLALLAGLAQTQGLLPDTHAPVADRLPGIGFDSAHNRSITWDHLLTQTSEWEGQCLGLPDTVERWRKVAMDPKPADGPKGGARPLQAPGSYWEYNDVRINQLSLALLHLFRQPLDQVFQQQLLQPLGGGAGFSWRGYDDAWVDVPGLGRVQSVPGGTHWGGGVSISADDQARIGQLVLDRGAVRSGAQAGRQLIAPGWVDGMAQPCAIAPFYGRLLWLNRDGRAYPGASADAVFMVGAGGHVTWVDPGLDAVVVFRWLDPAALHAMVARVAAVLRATRTTG